MTIYEARFDNELELQAWVEGNLGAFLGDCFHLGAFKVTTVAGKGGVPDGFAFKFREREWFVIENELIAHGVWPHIAEQVVRFVVAMQNPDTRRKIRDRLFDEVLESARKVEVIEALGTTDERLLQDLELFIESVDPQVVIFIDETNQDLTDMAHALDANTLVFRVKKYLVDGRSDYHSPDMASPAISTGDDKGDSADTILRVLDIIGPAEIEASVRGFKCYRTAKGEIVNIKRSKYHEAGGYYWYGIGTSARTYIEEYDVTHIIFVMGDEGFVKVPVDVITEYLERTTTSKNPDGSVRHWHIYLSPGPNPEFLWNNEDPPRPLESFYQTL